MRRRLRRYRQRSAPFVTPQISRLECRVGPLRDGHADLLARYDRVFRTRGLELLAVSAPVLELATEFRATLGFRTIDAIHLASARIVGAGVFLTGDRALRRSPGLAVEVVRPARG